MAPTATEKINCKWLITHEHVSVPVDMETGESDRLPSPKRQARPSVIRPKQFSRQTEPKKFERLWVSYNGLVRNRIARGCGPAQKSANARAGTATRTAFRTATRSMISCKIAPSSGGRYPAAAATMPTKLATIPPMALCNAIERMR